jgi:2-polyprenyl-6-methoxyphenol hydroxylase-like FAD-dependent oxidoreductase
MDDVQVLICGAGPTGLALALWLTLLGVKVRIIDRTDRPGTTSRALAVQARTLELYQQADLAEAVVAAGHKTPAVNLWVKGARKARVSFEDIGAGLSPYPFLLVYPQDEHEQLLIDRLAGLGVQVERQTRLADFTENGDGIEAKLAREGAGQVTCRASYLCGCDGARSAVRDILGTGFEGGTYRQLFYVADVEASGAPANGELHVDLDQADFVAIFPLAAEGRVRLVGVVQDERVDLGRGLSFEDVSRQAIDHMQLQVGTVNWFSTYQVHHRVTSQFRVGRAFLLGDAAHIHSPAGGQGMNTGLGDAINLAWKLAAALQGRGGQTLLDSYQAERLPFARRLVATTDRAFTFVTAEGPTADIVRTRLAPLLIPGLFSVERLREFMFRTVGQLTLNYRDGPLSAGRAGAVHGGDRLPWVAGADSFAPLKAMAWQAHVYGTAEADLQAWCGRAGLPLHVTAWSKAHDEAGLQRDAVYLTRPDSYVAVADPKQDAGALQAFFDARGIRLAG